MPRPFQYRQSTPKNPRVKADRLPQTPQRLEHIERAEGYACQCLRRLSKGQRDRGLAREIVNLIRCDTLDHLGHRLEVSRRHRTERYLVADAERNQTIQPGGVARSAMNDVAFLKKKSSKTS